MRFLPAVSFFQRLDKDPGVTSKDQDAHSSESQCLALITELREMQGIHAGRPELLLTFFYTLVSLGLEKILGYANATSFSVKRSTDSSFI
jgi:hypothetical protein